MARRDPKDSPTTPIIDKLGGIAAVANLTGSRYSAVASWKYAGKFPARTYLLLAPEIERHGLEASPSLWGMPEPERASA